MKVFKIEFLIIRLSTNLPWGHSKSHTKLGPFGLAVLTFIRYKQTNNFRQTPGQAKYIFR